MDKTKALEHIITKIKKIVEDAPNNRKSSFVERKAGPGERIFGMVPDYILDIRALGEYYSESCGYAQAKAKFSSDREEARLLEKRAYELSTKANLLNELTWAMARDLFEAYNCNVGFRRNDLGDIVLVEYADKHRRNPLVELLGGAPDED